MVFKEWNCYSNNIFSPPSRVIIFHLCCCSSNISSFTHCQNKKKHLLLQNFCKKKICKKRKEMLIKFKVKKIYPGCWCITYFKTKEKQKSNTCGIKIVFAHTFDITEMKKKLPLQKTFSTMKKNKILISVKLSNIVSHFCTFSINNNNTIDQSSIFV